MSRYAVVPSQGCYGSGEWVYAASLHADLRTAVARAAAATRSYRAAMARYGGSSGGYRVVETEARTRRDAVWLGHDLDRVAGCHPAVA